MDVSGKRKVGSVAVKSSFLFCQPCEAEGHHVEPDGFCQNCQEYLCNDCCRHHRKLKLTKHHEILDKHDMPKDRKVDPQVVVCTERCKKHPTELIKFLCKEHDFAGCGDCIITDHQQCKVDHIQEIAEQFVKGDGYNELMKQIGQLQSKVAEEVKSSQDLVRESDGEWSKAIEDIKNFRREVNAYLDESEQELIRKCDKKKEEIVSITNKRKDNITKFESELGNIKENTDTKECWIASMVLTAYGHVLCTDVHNNVKVVDSRTLQYVSSLSLSTRPWSIVAIGNASQFAVTLPFEKKIQFLNFDNNLKTVSSFSTDGRCYGLAYNENSLIVSFDDPLKVQILTLQGNVKLTLEKVCSEDNFGWIGCIAVDIKQSAMFVSDCWKHCVVKLKMDGTEIARYSDPELKCPRSLIVCADGSLLVCSQDSESVHLVSGTCKRKKILLNKANGAIRPSAICFDDNSNTLYLSNFSQESNTIKVFRMVYDQKETTN